MKDIRVFDNFLDEEDHGKIYKALDDGEAGLFPWYYNDNVNDENDPKNHFQFAHCFYDKAINSNFFNLIEPLISKLKMTAIVKVKANLLLKTDKPVIHVYHTDFNWKYKWWTAIYYVNSNNGKTIFKKDKKSIDSVANRLVLFDGRMLHCGTTPTDTKKRIVINFNFFNKELEE